jgi:hypothetical protein
MNKREAFLKELNETERRANLSGKDDEATIAFAAKAKDDVLRLVQCVRELETAWLDSQKQIARLQMELEKRPVIATNVPLHAITKLTPKH